MTTHPLTLLRGKHALFEIVAVSGGLVGVALGAVIAWPIGAIVGGVIGAVGGLFVGKGLEDAASITAEHDRAVDGQIGVMGGELGAQEIASSRLSRPSETESPGVLLHRDHARIESAMAEVLRSIECGAWQNAQTLWSELEHRLQTHLATEEADLFPMLREADPDEVDGLLAEHANLRWLIAEFRKKVVVARLVGTGAAGVELSAALRDHRVREDRLAYPIADSRLSSSSVVDIEMSLDA